MVGSADFTNDPLATEHLPRLAPQPFESVSTRYRTARMAITSAVLIVVATSVGAISWLAASNTDGPWAARIGIGAVIAVLGAGVLGLMLVRAEYNALGYLVRERDISVKRGVILRTTKTIPYERVQNVRVVRGPVDRALGLAALTVSSAGGSLLVPGLPEARAESLKEAVVERAGIDENRE